MQEMAVMVSTEDSPAIRLMLEQPLLEGCAGITPSTSATCVVNLIFTSH
jgi:hypothetical protein